MAHRDEISFYESPLNALIDFHAVSLFAFHFLPENYAINYNNRQLR